MLNEQTSPASENAEMTEAAVPNSPETEQAIQSQEGGVVAKLEAYLETQKGLASTVLPATGIKVTWPKFQPRPLWLKAQRMAKKETVNVTDIYITLLCEFGGEKLTLGQFKKLIPNNDNLHLTAEIMGDDDDEEGNG
ncbi:hypothetical protein [Epibacterium ulvae]|uniref:hypothetical protein n=1 Tax=Epibacterium ulvae TaxID=1156985 RepID=UPI0024929210|nr:hypothetical protein [Epibacterium ulvae]